MSNDIHPVPGLTAGSVPTAIEPEPYRPARGRFRRVAAGVAVGLALGAGGVAVAQFPLHDSQVGSVFTATQNPDDDSAAAEPEEPAPAQVGAGHAEDD